ncbi:NUDIX domain-containing protein [Microbacterium imperiale]|uniref:NTP pyrophosphohydrolase n=1 Tax=Microbacterium imperiale TaxID=33884 RepID=A0A9W6HGD7_9MICO|nr:NUDIX domain-containing protein [Microbacterium imperiale]MBP2420409.1 8-oxo-dGTP pyrophosphatase MutT (NUDIX family) [Microbacterium imperiale]MDS0197733.1 NUDIX domain-containing protein [Microbacterium imperiale]BFE40751.1 NUDIX domain-containing protein [Microbacterium imperiale]GLJ80104.1 NTP pyrophosphohydrolase [Microbacterium imperiale]
MTDAASAAPRPPHGQRDPGDAWVVAPTGERYWGRFGAAGLLAVDAERGVLLQHRVSWSHFGNTWGLPGGARHAGESAPDGALRESAEEAGVPAEAVKPRLLSILDVGVWTYGTLVADVTTPFEPVISDPESRELAWVPLEEVDAYPLHPGFAASWPRLRGLLTVRPTVVVDLANVVGSVPDGWWRDRAGAASRLLAELAGLAAGGVDAAGLGLGEDIWFPRFVAVVEGRARDVEGVGAVELVRADGSGDDAIVAVAERAVSAGERVSVVTADRELRARVEALGATALGPSWLRDRL